MIKKIIKGLLTTVVVCSMSIPVYAASQWSFYGSSNMATFQNNYSKEMSASGKAYSSLDVGLNSNSVIGAKVKADDINAVFEYGPTPDLRLLYATWETGSGTLLFGQTYGPVNLFISNQVYGDDSDLLNVGGLYGGRTPQISFSTSFGLTVAALTASKTEPTGFGVISTPLPKIEASYSFAAGPVSLTAAYGMNSVKAETATDTVTTNSSVLGVMAKMTFGSAWAGLDYVSAVNPGNYGLWMAGGSTSATYDAASGELTDASTTGMIVVGGAKLSDTMSIEAGYGSQSNDSGVSGATKDDTTCFYVQLPIKLDASFSVIPEIGSYDYGKNASDVKEGSQSYFGAKWAMSF